MGTPVDSGNRGVIALGSSLAGLFLKANPQAKVSFLTSHREPTQISIWNGQKRLSVPVVNYRMSPRSKPSQHLFVIVAAALCYKILPVKGFRSWIEKRIPFIGLVSSADMVGDVRGGDSFSDIYGLKRFAMAFLPSFAVLLIKGEMVHFPQTYGPFKSKTARRLACYLLRKSSTVIARDTKSHKAATELVLPSQKVGLTPDVAFSLLPLIPKFPTISKSVSDAEELRSLKTIGINVNGLVYNGGYSRNNMFGLKMQYDEFLFELCQELLKITDRDIVLVPHTFAPNGEVESDNEASLKLRDRLPNELQERIRIVTEEYDQYEIKGVIGLCDFFIGARMHSCIAALSQGVPCVGVAYSMKFLGVFESVGMGDWVVDGRTTDNADAVKRIVELYEQKESYRETLSNNAAEAKDKLYNAFTNLLDSVN